MGDTESSGTVKLGTGATLQIVGVLVAIGIAWGTLTTRQNAMESRLQDDKGQQAQILQKLGEIEQRMSALEYAVRLRYPITRSPRDANSQHDRPEPESKK